MIGIAVILIIAFYIVSGKLHSFGFPHYKTCVSKLINLYITSGHLGLMQVFIRFTYVTKSIVHVFRIKILFHVFYGESLK